MMRTIVAGLAALIVLVGCTGLVGQDAQVPGEGNVLRFNFGPECAPEVPGFVTVAGKTQYEKKKGYGWVNIEGQLQAGQWHGDKAKTWECAGNLNLVLRKGPDGLAASYASGPATFALDLKPGKYEVWVLSGDWGLLECIPREPYRIMVEGAAAYDFKMTADEFYRKFETPVLEDDLTQTGVWRRYVEPRFVWRSVVVDVQDGQLSVNVEGGRRDLSMFNFVGDYAITETRRGPKVRFTGALNALVVMPVSKDAVTGLQEVDRINTWRQQDFAKKWPLKKTEVTTKVNWSAQAARRGYAIFIPNTLKPVNPEDRAEQDLKTLTFRATPGEYVPITFAVCPLRNIGTTNVSVSDLNRPGAAGASIPSGAMELGVVRYVARLTGKRSKTWKPTPVMIIPANTWRIGGDITKQFWLTLHVPTGAQPGVYNGAITLTSEKAPATEIKLGLEVLPFKLKRPTHLATGMTYFSPLQYSYFGEKRFWKRMEVEFADMRAHNMTSIQYTGIRMDDYDRIDKAFALYRKAGFEHPVNLLECYGGMCRFRRAGTGDWSEAFYTGFVDFTRKFLEEAKRRNWPPVIIDFGDEFTNSAKEKEGAELARRLKKIPGIVTGADSNGYLEVTLMAPEVDIVAFNRGWAGPKGVNRGKQLLKKETVELIKKAGAIPWLVNIGKDRFSNGYWFWKMVRIGIRGKMEWMYRGYNGMPFNPFDGRPMRGHIVYPGPDGTVVPSLNWEWVRMGLDDIAYLHTLEKTLEAARKNPARKAAVEKADAFIKKLDGMIDDNYHNYLDRKAKEEHTWPPERYDQVRGEVVDLILELSQK